MSNDDDGITEIVRELQTLHLRQAELYEQLENHQATQQVAAGRRTVEPRRNQPRTTFQVGDHVRVKNPRFIQATSGIIIRISATRITIRTVAGNTIVRAPKNLEHIAV